MILVVDNYDSFTYNLVHYLAELGAQTHVVRNDDLTVEEAWASTPEAVPLSPGPSAPERAATSRPLSPTAPQNTATFGVCLRHPPIAQGLGSEVIRAQTLMHGNTTPIEHEAASLSKGLP